MQRMDPDKLYFMEVRTKDNYRAGTGTNSAMARYAAHAAVAASLLIDYYQGQGGNDALLL